MYSTLRNIHFQKIAHLWYETHTSATRTYIRSTFWFLPTTDQQVASSIHRQRDLRVFFYIYLCVYSTTFMPKKPPFYGYDFLDVYSGMLKKSHSSCCCCWIYTHCEPSSFSAKMCDIIKKLAFHHHKVHHSTQLWSEIKPGCF